ncbi:hypothetical protein BU26DRAFT_502400 [Trematosphaeria pertusa]|uniref:magnesium chelatase n=1 Tax=Trematosphaeria pertusa TaxID=390896 RepID=A0A6A6IPT9_9PLEO|nr:uncharacterized protein BU26DRAFT_502400 [Trematosphaeria pertusa]KAF2251802.1 hypothetical protein BU26DRAFT_502400 [Trematosphaeria pertusa]
MEEADDDIAERVQALSDIELAVLLCLITAQHCIIETDNELLHDLDQELRLVAFKVFGLTWAVLECSETTTVDDFGVGILAKDERDDYFNRRHEQGKSELIRGKRNYTRTAVHAAPRPFLFIALNESESARLATHLNDQFFISHKHEVDDRFPNLQELQEKEPVSEDDASTSSVVHSPPETFEKRNSSSLVFSQEVQISSEVRAYLHNIVVFMRLHRAVAGGISAMATRHFNILSRALAPLHDLSYITPSLVALAARKIYPHRIAIASPENERSMQWGSSLDAVKAVLEGVTVEDVIEEVLQSVEVPL